MTSINHSKRSALTLNLHSDDGCKKTKFSPGVLGTSVLSSPDVKKLQMTTPEIENFIFNHHSSILQTPTPNTAAQILFPKSVSDDQDLYSQEFVNALGEFPSNDSSRVQVELPKSSSSSNSSINNFMNIDNQYQGMSSSYSMAMSPESVIVKEEPQTVPSLGSTPPLSPINMESQERIKLERKRMRNRVAASKCRKRKLERIAKLEDKVKLLKGENNELGQVVIRLKEEVCSLKQRVMKHVDNGCKMIVTTNF